MGIVISGSINYINYRPYFTSIITMTSDIDRPEMVMPPRYTSIRSKQSIYNFFFISWSSSTNKISPDI